MGGVLRFHHRMARQAAKLDRLHHLDTFVSDARENDDVDHRCTEENQQPASSIGHVQIEDWQRVGHAFAAGHPARLAAPQQGADRNQNQAENEDHRQDQIRQDAQVRPAFEAELLHLEQARNENQAATASAVPIRLMPLRVMDARKCLTMRFLDVDQRSDCS